jgi:beta-lactamase regulating signal transducer with metallopeptidase domain
MAMIELLASVVLTLALHASILLGLVWLAERLRWLCHPEWLELAWRCALFGPLLSTMLAFLPLSQTTMPHAARSAPPPMIAVNAAVPSPASTTFISAAPMHAESINDASGTPDTSLPIVFKRAPLAVSVTIAQIPVAFWLAGLLLSAWPFVRHWRVVRGLHRQALAKGQPASPALQRQADELAVRMDVREPLLCVLDQADSPMILPDGLLLLPAWSEKLSTAQQRALLAHEFAHLQRRDPFWRIAQRAVLLPLFFHPLAWLAQRRLESLAEDACDASAAQVLGTGRPLAECLEVCLSHTRERGPVLGVAMAREPGAVVRRVQHLLEESMMSHRPLSTMLRRGALTLSLIALIALPGLAVTTMAAERKGQSISVHSTNSSESVKWNVRSEGYFLAVTQKGKVEFNADEADVATMDKGATLEIKETKAGIMREMRFEGDGTAIDRRYRFDGKEQAIDAEGKAWLSAMLPRMLRETGVQADVRAKRLLAKGGTKALLDEIELISGDHARGRYLGVLFANARLNDAEQARALSLITAMGSDFEKRTVLQAALKTQGLGAASQVALLEAAASIGSDFERAELLSSLSGRVTMLGDALPAWRKAVTGIGSDFERRRALTALIENGEPKVDAVLIALDNAQTIVSDFEKRQLLEICAPYSKGSPAVRDAYLRVADRIGSDFERRQALTVLLRNASIDAASADAVLTSITGIGSDFERRQALEQLAHVMPGDPALIEHYRSVARQLGDFERGQAEKALDRFARTN